MQGLTLVHFSAQREHFVSHVVSVTKRLRLSEAADEYKPQPPRLGDGTFDR